ncbi:MAG: SPOR domain-containing protein [Ectothiorhodospiraceae bacterium]|nr:SPOR domain-containing protein [Ectothiorhodospiraceae bacterium]
MQLDNARLAELGLRRQPFPENETLDDTGQDAHVAEIVQLLRNSGDTVLLTGPVGVGVSRLLLQVEDACDGGLRPLVIDGESRPTPDDVCHMCLEAFDLPPAPATSGPKLLDYVADWLDSLAQASDRPVLLVDNAHLLGEQTLDALLSMQEGEEEDYIGPALLLAGTPDLEDRVARLGELLEDEHFHVVRLEPWTVDQVAAYIRKGLEQAGGAGTPAAELLDPEEVHLRSGGYPAQVRAACLQMLNGPVEPDDGFLDRLPLPSITPLARIPANLRSRHGATILITAVLFLLVVLFTLLRPGSDEPALPEQELVLQPRPVPAQPAGPADEQRPDEAPAMGDPDQGRELLPAIPGEAAPPTPEPDPETLEEAPPPTIAAPGASEEQDPAVPDVAQPAEPETGRPEPGETAAVPEAEPEAPAAEATPEPETPADTAESAPVQDGATWLAARVPDHFTIQIVAAANRDTLEAFVRDQTNASALRIVPTMRDGQPWFVVIAGDYQDREAARSALESLPPGQREHGAWVRSFESLQTAD